MHRLAQPRRTAVRWVGMGELTTGFVATLAFVAILTAAALTAAWLIARRHGPTATKRAMLWTALAAVVCTLLWWTLALPAASVDGGGFNLVPGREIARAIRELDGPYGMINLYGNLVVFVPVGLLVAWLATGPWWARVALAAAIGAAFSATIELAQLTANRIADIDDVILNAAGAFVGGWLGVALRALVYRWRRPTD